jgi:glycerol-3-phosphate O-acyltransferase
MAKRQLTKPYEPNPALSALYHRFFDHIQVDDAWVQGVRDLSHRGSVVYVLRNLNFIDFFALDHLTKRYGLPQIRFVNDLGLWILNPMGKGWLNAILPRRGVTPSDELEDALGRGGSAALFLKRPPSVIDVAAGAAHGRGLREGDDLVRTLFDLQRTRREPILMVPQVFVWTKQPDTRGRRPIDFFLGPREWPSPARVVGQFLYNYRHVALKVGEPLDLREFLNGSNGVSDAVRVRRVTYAMLRRLERERRIVVGPAEKPPDRVRHEIVRSPKLRSVIQDLAGERLEDRHVLTARALGMLKRLQATPDMDTVRGLEAIFDRVFHRIYAGIDYDKRDIERVREASKEGTVVLLPSHKSHIDYLILSYIFNSENIQLPLIAAGDNLDFFPLGPIFRRGGAFFIRRSFRGDRLYAAAVDAYIRRLLREGYPIEVFIEGGRSRTGKLLPPKFGLLGMVVDAALSVQQTKTYFVPVSIGYERIVESYDRELSGGEKTKEDAAGLLKSSEVLRHRYGRINLQFGEILTLGDVRDDLGLDPNTPLTPPRRRALVTRLGNRVMDEINRVTAVTPGALAALVLLTHSRRGISHEELVDRSRRLLDVLQRMGARVTPAMQTSSGALRPEAVREAAQMFVDAEMLEIHTPEAALGDARARRRRGVQAGDGVIYAVVEDKRLGLDVTKNIIVHFFVERALVALAMLVPPGPPVAVEVVRDRVQKLSRLFKHEFRFRADAPFNEIFDQTISGLAKAGKVELDGDKLAAGPGVDGWSGNQWLELYASILRSFLEGYRIAARGLGSLLKGAQVEKDLVKKALASGNRMFLAGEIERREAVSKPILQNAYKAFLDQGYLVTTDGKLGLAESFATAKAVGAIEGRVAGYLGDTAR